MQLQDQVVEQGFIGDGTDQVGVSTAVADHHGFKLVRDLPLQVALDKDAEEWQILGIDLIECLFIHLSYLCLLSKLLSCSSLVILSRD